MPRKYSFWTALLGAMIGTASASPMYYTFKGAVTGFYTDGPGIYSETSTHFSMDEAVSLVFMIDTELPGFYTYSGIKYTVTDDGWGHYFYSAYVGGSAVTTDPATTIGPGSSDYAFNAASRGGITGSNGDPTGYDNIRVDSYSLPVSDWAPSMTGFGGTDLIFSGSGMREFNYFSLTLTDVSAVRPDIGSSTVPEPTTLALLGFGLLGLAAAGRKRK